VGVGLAVPPARGIAHGRPVAAYLGDIAQHAPGLLVHGVAGHESAGARGGLVVALLVHEDVGAQRQRAG
jgi:hypothetical protein